MRPHQLLTFAWPIERLPEALEELVRCTGLRDEAVGCGDLWRAPCSADDVGDWLRQAAKRAGCEAETLETTLGELETELAAASPALLQISETSYLAVVKAHEKSLRLLTPAFEQKSLHLNDVCGAIREPAEAPHRQTIEALLSDAQIPASKRANTLRLLLDEQLCRHRFSGCWTLRSEPGRKPLRLLKEAGAFGNAAGMIIAHTLQYVLWVTSWIILGDLTTAGHMDRAWIFAWALLLITIVPCQVATTWLQGMFAIGLGGFLKRRLLVGALKLRPEEMRQGGIGGFLGQALEAEAVESLALSGGIAGLLATIEILMAIAVLGKFAWVLAGWTLLAGWTAWRFLRRYEGWTGTRMGLTENLIESMVGHRTRLAQLKRSEWHDGEDQALTDYVGVSKSLDQTGAWLIAAIPRGWLLAGLACLIPSIAAGRSVGTQTAVTMGGVLLAYSALRRLTSSFADIAAAWVACKSIAPLFHAAARPELLGEASITAKPDKQQLRQRSKKVIEADRLSFRYRSTGRHALQSGSLVIWEGDRILLEGPSGGGKTTFASLLAGVRQPESGLLLADGLDRQTLGDRGWRKRIASVPQFHENHILTETLAFNLLFGRRWPATQSDMREAEAVCRELGLGAMMDAMPSGLMQMVGEGGWQLSHGERSRVFIARALLQDAEMLILDESFGALDPENAMVALEATIRRAKTLLVIAHP